MLQFRKTVTLSPSRVPTRSRIELAELTSRRGDARPIFFLLLLGAIARAGYHVLFSPWWAGDTISYIDASSILSHGYFTDGGRTPGYPLFLALAGWMWSGKDAFFSTGAPGAAIVAAWLQSALGLAAVALVFYSLRALRVREPLAIAGAAFFAVLHAVCQFEMAILAQSLSLFALALGIWLFTRTMARIQEQKSPALSAVLTGIAFSFAVLVRPENLVFFVALIAAPALLWIVLKLRRRDSSQRRAWLIVACALPLAAAPAVLAWMTWNYLGIGRFQITTLTSWNRSSSVYNLFDRVDPKDRVLGDLLVRADLIRNHPEQIPGEKFFKPPARGQVVQDTFIATFYDIVMRRGELPLAPAEVHRSRFGRWIRSFASDERRRFTHRFLSAWRIPAVDERDPNDIGDYVGAVSLRLQMKYPGAWLGNAFRNFFRDGFRFSIGPPAIDETKDPHSFSGGSVVRSASLWNFAAWLNRLEAPVVLIFFMFTLGLALLSPLTLLRSHSPATPDVASSAISLGVVGTFAACCLFASYMPHYGEPHWPAIVICGIYGIDRTLRRISEYQASHTRPPS
jgi:hypothetical protein